MVKMILHVISNSCCRLPLFRLKIWPDRSFYNRGLSTGFLVAMAEVVAGLRVTCGEWFQIVMAFIIR